MYKLLTLISGDNTNSVGIPIFNSPFRIGTKENSMLRTRAFISRSIPTQMKFLGVSRLFVLSFVLERICIHAHWPTKWRYFNWRFQVKQIQLIICLSFGGNCLSVVPSTWHGRDVNLQSQRLWWSYSQWFNFFNLKMKEWKVRIGRYKISCFCTWSFYTKKRLFSSSPMSIQNL